MMRARASIVASLACLSLAGATLAAEHSHVVRSGESASSLARDYYGTFDLTDLLLRYNARPDSGLRVGETVRVPYSEVHTVRPGDTGSVLAKRYLGRPSAWPSIARLNGVSSSEPLRIGQELVIPVALAHTLKRGETLGELASELYGASSLGRVIADYNRIKDPRRLSVGTRLEIPLVAFRLARPLSSARAKRVAKPRTAVSTADKKTTAAHPAQRPARRFESQIAEARDHYQTGRFEDARRTLERISKRIDRKGTAADRSELWALLAFVYVAFDQEKAACEAYARTLLGETKSTLDPDLVSPKIRRLLARCASPA